MKGQVSRFIVLFDILLHLTPNCHVPHNSSRVQDESKGIFMPSNKTAFGKSRILLIAYEYDNSCDYHFIVLCDSTVVAFLDCTLKVMSSSLGIAYFCIKLFRGNSGNVSI